MHSAMLQVVRWNGDPADVIAQANALGCGLTCGIQTRIDSRAQALAHAAHVGNIYINRNMTGAVVGVRSLVRCLRAKPSAFGSQSMSAAEQFYSRPF